MATKNKRKLTRNQEEYLKQRKRIQQAVNRAKKRGYIWEESIVPSLELPTRVTSKMIKELSSIKGNKLYSSALYLIDKQSGELVSGVEGRKFERRVAGIKSSITKKRKQFDSGEKKPANFTDTVLNSLEEQLATYEPIDYVSAKVNRKKYANTLLGMLERQIDLYGRDSVAKKLENNAFRINTLLESVLYDSFKQEEFNMAFNELATLIVDRPLDIAESIELEEMGAYYNG